MKVHCLGTTGYHPSPTRHTACYYLPEAGLVLDAGTGMFGLTALLLAEPRDSLDIFLSHAHLDHVIGLTFLLDTFAVTTLKHVRVLGMGVKLEAVRQHLFSEHLFPLLPPEIEFESLDQHASPLELPGGARIGWFPLEHPGGSIGVRVEYGGKSLAYVTDTVARPDSPYVRQIEGVDLLLHECYFTDEFQALAEKTGHTWLSAATEIVRSVLPGKTGLIHLNPLAEVLRSNMILTDQHKQLGMFIPRDGECVEW
ncbi:MAG: MBL fold metallo-hydrolase [Pirellulaceae bacterium]|nr:MBL fold metallo-hydrolase [Pirellulaceae bacterium]